MPCVNSCLRPHLCCKRSCWPNIISVAPLSYSLFLQGDTIQLVPLFAGDGSVQLSVSRVGSLDTVDIQWTACPLVRGALTPPTGSVVLTPSQQSAVFFLMVS